jgi:hypothetical protein
MSRFLKWVGLVSLAGLLAAQFVSPKRIKRRINPALTVEANTAMTPEVSKILQRACDDCHSEKTVWRWYGRVAPISWLQMADVGMGRDEVNFSRWKEYPAKQQANMLKNTCQFVRKGDMPLWYYKPLHQGSWLSSGEVQQLCDWTTKEIDRLGK